MPVFKPLKVLLISLLLSCVAFPTGAFAQYERERQTGLSVYFYSGFPKVSHRMLGMTVDPPLEEVVVRTDVESELCFTVGRDTFLVHPGSIVHFWMYDGRVEQVRVDSGAVMALTQKKPFRGFLPISSARTQVDLKEGLLFLEVLKAKDYLAVIDGEIRLATGDRQRFEQIESGFGFQARKIYLGADNQVDVRPTRRQRYSDHDIGLMAAAAGHSSWHRRLTNEQGRHRRKLF